MAVNRILCNEKYAEKNGVMHVDTGKPPLCKGRCQPSRLTEGLKRSSEYVKSAEEQKVLLHNPPVKNQRFLPVACGQPCRGSGCPLDSHSLPRLRFRLPFTQGSLRRSRASAQNIDFSYNSITILKISLARSLRPSRNRAPKSASTPVALAYSAGVADFGTAWTWEFLPRR